MSKRQMCMAILTNGEECPKLALSGSYIYHGDSEIYSRWDGLRISWVRVPLCAWHLAALTDSVKGKREETYETYLARTRKEREARGDNQWVSDTLEEEEKELFKK